MWIENHFYDFREDDELFEELENFIDIITQASERFGNLPNR